MPYIKIYSELNQTVFKNKKSKIGVYLALVCGD